jgi:hypothetical protein
MLSMEQRTAAQEAAAERALGMISGSHLVGRVEAGAPGLAWEA